MIVKEQAFKGLVEALVSCLAGATAFDGIRIGPVNVSRETVNRAALMALVALDPAKGTTAAVFVEGEQLGTVDPATGKYIWWPPTPRPRQSVDDGANGKAPDRGDAGNPYDV